MTSKILYGTDFSLAAIRAATAAAAMAKRLDGSLILAHVIEDPGVGGEEVSQYLHAAGERRLRAEAERLRQTGASVEEVLLVGSVYQSLVELACKAKPLVTILASRTRSNAMERWLIGSVAERVAQSIPFPIVVVRDAAPLEEWAAGRRPLGILVAADLSANSNAPLLWAGELSRIGPCRLTVAHVNWIPDEFIRLGARGPLPLSENPPDVQSILERDLREKVRSLLGDVDVDILVEPRWGRADVPLADMATRAGADLIVSGTRRQNSWWLFDESVSRGLLQCASLNIAIVPENSFPVSEAPLPTIRRVLVATDFSDLANRAIPFAYSLLPTGGMVCLAHVTGEIGGNPEEITSRLRALIPRDTAIRGITTETATISNRQTAEGICQLAGQFGADVICLGTHGRSSLTQTLLGSVTQAVAAGSRRPVMLVPQTV